MLIVLLKTDREYPEWLVLPIVGHLFFGWIINIHYAGGRLYGSAFEGFRYLFYGELGYAAELALCVCLIILFLREKKRAALVVAIAILWFIYVVFGVVAFSDRMYYTEGFIYPDFIEFTLLGIIYLIIAFTLALAHKGRNTAAPTAQTAAYNGAYLNGGAYPQGNGYPGGASAAMPARPNAAQPFYRLFCPSCGTRFPEGKKYCDQCGTQLSELRQPEAINRAEYAAPTNAVSELDAPSTGAAVLGFFLPFAGFIMWVAWNSTMPQKAKSAGKGALIGVITYTALIVIYYIAVVAWIMSL